MYGKPMTGGREVQPGEEEEEEMSADTGLGKIVDRQNQGKKKKNRDAAEREAAEKERIERIRRNKQEQGRATE